MNQIAEILAKELAAGTFDKTCSANEQYYMRQFVAQARKADAAEYKDFGMANSWTVPPERVTRCNQKLHKVTKKGIGKCLTEIRCDLCRYYYQIDSSD